MTTVSKLGIQGIRSFDHERLEVLDFERPVTLIVGPNGSGKTTIIECLKMASTGILPPNAKNGHGFVHDPQVAHLPEIKAQIRMLFNMQRDKEICAIRSFQLTNKRVAGKIKPTFKALESVLRTKTEDGSNASMSHRCTNMDTQVPELMGVSRAILENVVFCHQEESSWPLMDAASVKKRFDDIFGATRYTQALLNIKALQREWAKNTRDRRAEADCTQIHVDQATKLRGQKEERDRAAEEIVVELKGVDDQIVSATETCQKAEMEMVQHESCGVRIAELRSLLGRCENDRREVARTMAERGQDVYRESLEELQTQAKHFRERVLLECEQKVKQAKSNLNNGEAAFHTSVDEARKLREDMGETVAAAEHLESRKTELATRLEKAKKPSVASLRAQLDAMAAEMTSMERERRQRDNAADEALQAAERAHREATLEVSRNESRGEDASTVIRRLEQEAKTLARAQPDLDTLVRAMRENETALGAEGSDARLRRLEARQEEIGRRRHDLQYSITRKSSEVAQLEAQSDAHVEVDAVRKRLREAETELNNKAGDARPRFVGLLGQMPEPAEADSKVAAEIQQLEDKLKRQRQNCHELHQRHSGTSARRAAAEADLRKLQTEEARLAAELQVPAMPGGGAGPGGSGASEFRARLAAQREQVELGRKDLAMTESAQHMYEKFREKSRTKNACQFCRRAFCDQSERNAFEECVERLIVKIPMFLEESRKRFDESQGELNRLDAQRPRWERLEQLRQAEIPHKMKDIAALTQEERASHGVLEPQDAEQRRLEEGLRQLQDMRAEAANLQRIANSVEELRAQVRAKEARLLGANSKVSLQAERDQLRTLQEQLCELGREEDAVRTQRDLLAKQQEQLRTQLAEQKGRLQLLQAQVARRGDVDSELAARQSELRECSEAVTRHRSAAEAASAKAREVREERASVAAHFRKNIDERDAQVRAMQREVDALTEIESSIEVMSSRVKNADALKAKMRAADEAVRASERELEGLRAKLEGEEERKRKREEVREVLEINVRLKGLEAEIQRNEAEVNGLLKELGGRDLEALRADVDACRVRTMELQRKRAFRDGELAQTREAAKQIEVDLSSPLYTNIEQRHREAIIKHESAAYAARDLGRYHAALDKALMKFHTMKMAEINKTIKELWQRVYRGRDIDYIAIRSDTEEGTDAGGGQQEEVVSKTLRSYNYRVVMACGDVEMDMRGRCSAGQRVLASLIIRLALADSFCVSCGVLALDEPTTNLDAANIRGLAEALAGLIEARRQQSRFQLILITHDEVFVDHLSQLQVCDWYYHIQKDEQGSSKIERRDMRLLTG